VPGRVFISDKLMAAAMQDNALLQVVNVAHLPGIIDASMAMPDIHWGYGFPIGGVAAFDAEQGVISPGGVGYDINCGVRLATTSLDREDIASKLEKIANSLAAGIPAGVGKSGPIKLSKAEMKRVLSKGAEAAVEMGAGEESDLDRIESRGSLPDADPDAVSHQAKERGADQLGTLGSGNHFVEVGYVEEIFDSESADAFGLRKNQVTLLIHSGSRGLGYQVCDDHLAILTKYIAGKKIDLPDRQLACAPFKSPEGAAYFAAMCAAANYAFANRQFLLDMARDLLLNALGISPKDFGMRLLYDVAHNIAKLETHLVEGHQKRMIVHRKGATRSFGPGNPEVPSPYRNVGQPVLIPGDMGRASYVLVGTSKAMEISFGSTCHGAGRLLSRKSAIKSAKGRSIENELYDNGIIVRAHSRSSLAEEMPDAYKNVTDVVEVVHRAGLSRKVARLAPLVVIKG